MDNSETGGDVDENRREKGEKSTVKF